MAQGPQNDPDADGYNNAREQILGTDPQVRNEALELDVSRLSAGKMRLSFPSVNGRNYEVRALPDLRVAGTTNVVSGGFPELEQIFDSTAFDRLFFQVLETTP